MKLTKQQLKQIIKEELSAVMGETRLDIGDLEGGQYVSALYWDNDRKIEVPEKGQQIVEELAEEVIGMIEDGMTLKYILPRLKSKMLQGPTNLKDHMFKPLGLLIHNRALEIMREDPSTYDEGWWYEAQNVENEAEYLGQDPGF